MTEGFGETWSPNGWTSYVSVSNFENLFTKTWTYPGVWTGSQLKHAWGSVTTKTSENPPWTTTPSETGSATPEAIGSALEVPSWWSDTWVAAGWSELQTTWLARGLSWTWTNGLELLRIGFGALEVVWGAGMSVAGFIGTAITGPVGAGVGITGVGLTAVGIDNVLTGFFNIRYGRVGKGFSVLETGAYAVTGNETASVLLPGLLSGGLYSYGRAVMNSARNAAIGAAVESPTWAFAVGVNKAIIPGAGGVEGAAGLFRWTAQWVPYTGFWSFANRLGFRRAEIVSREIGLDLAVLEAYGERYFNSILKHEQAHEAFSILLPQLTVAQRLPFFGAYIKYPNEIIAYTVDNYMRGGRGVFFRVPMAPLQAITSLSASEAASLGLPASFIGGLYAYAYSRGYFRTRFCHFGRLETQGFAPVRKGF